jgi:predicted short-subunit dehydrogenase-like oxidoreductase (DUF2520 family)
MSPRREASHRRRRVGGKLSRGATTPRPYTVAVLGAGNVGSALLRELPKAGVKVVAKWSRGSGKPLPTSIDADLILLAVSDSAVAHVAAQLEPKRNQLVAHLAGALPLSALHPAKRRGSIHPLRAITAGDDFHGAACGIAGSDASARAQLKWLATKLGMAPMNVPDSARALYHASAVLSAGAQVALFSEAIRAFRIATRATEPAARAALLPLALGALKKLDKLTAAAAITGPAARGDLRTIDTHRDALPKDLLALYDELTRIALTLRKKPQR